MAKLDNKSFLVCCANGAGSSLMMKMTMQKVLDKLGLSEEALDKFYEDLETNNIDIDIPDADILPPLDDDLLPEIEEIAEIEEVTEEELNADPDSLADTFSTDDPVAPAYLYTASRLPVSVPVLASASSSPILSISEKGRSRDLF